MRKTQQLNFGNRTARNQIKNWSKISWHYSWYTHFDIIYISALWNNKITSLYALKGIKSSTYLEIAKVEYFSLFGMGLIFGMGW